MRKVRLLKEKNVTFYRILTKISSMPLMQFGYWYSGSQSIAENFNQFEKLLLKIVWRF